MLRLSRNVVNKVPHLVILNNVKAERVQLCQQRTFWGWLNIAFNMVDKSRIKEVGPDRAAAEWLLRNGASVKWEGAQEFFKDYNSLPVGKSSLKIEEIDATESSIMAFGFPHLIGLQHVRKIIFHRTNLLTDDALVKLQCLENTLKDLQVSGCKKISEKGLLSLTQLKNLEKVLLYDLPKIKDKDKCVQELSSALPKCKVEFPSSTSK